MLCFPHEQGAAGERLLLSNRIERAGVAYYLTGCGGGRSLLSNHIRTPKIAQFSPPKAQFRHNFGI